MIEQRRVVAVTNLSDRRIVSRINLVTGTPELVIQCPLCSSLGDACEFVLPEGSTNEESATWADEVDEHFREVHR